MIIDCHGHFTSEPAGFRAHRAAQVAFAEGRGDAPAPVAGIPDADLHTAVETNQLRLQQERGTDVTLLSPRASAMGHHVPGQDVADAWARLSNDTIGRIVDMFPRNFAGVCQLPQTVDGDLGPAVAELERCVDAGFVGCNVNPDPSGGAWTAPPLTDRWWDPLWSALERARVPAMIHVSGSTRPGVHTTGAHYLAGDTIAFMQLLDGDLFDRHPGLRLIIPHGGGAAPYHWGRYRGLAIMLGTPSRVDQLRDNVFFDTCVYHQAGIDLLLDVVGPENVLFGSELLGAVKTDDPRTGHPFDDTKRYIDAAGLDDDARQQVFERNARRVYPLLDARLQDQERAVAPARRGAQT
ncbi:amidohydrolase family protein [Modestobacter roseus]|uniref:4-oxalmesaconate hydratase n=1 Tax=Modestobacter roseus TaxID=1181884 RepID=A0A562IP96_9ACTN|nr:amidohydrolase family protein [Modestobacter roseus]TWH72722.1 4-oxalmesaconate hydratase [Modestobacter roseus]